MTALLALRLDGELTIQTAADCHLTLLSSVNETAGGDAPGLALDLSSVVGLDSAGVQLLMAARHSLAARGKTLHLAGSSRSVDEVLATLGLADWLPVATAPDIADPAERPDPGDALPTARTDADSDTRADALCGAAAGIDSADLTPSEGAGA
ncbi:MAG TPA: STAS domain-containing protein [Burkholderiaceae bacterium]|nr:STAS domain-containing protein [Burkholderiaceae bacterium]